MARNSKRKVKPVKPQVRCAVYTRKSSEEGLEQEFNSLDAQREACEAYIVSQKHGGWKAITTPYDDGGISGGTMERPGLQRLLDDIRNGKVDVVVVYKVDRLTRSLSDFAKIVDIFDAHEVSFVSVTQAFNTTTSMGRLTLNVLLSFAQFEREVTGERIRDKIAASKKKGMWMGGTVSLGYDCRDRKLVVNDPEAETVRHIFKRYVALGSVRSLKQELEAEGIRSKSRVSENGRRWGGNPLTRGALYLMLQNRIYLGEIVHKDKSYPGEHKAIVDKRLWDKVQNKLAANRVERRSGGDARSPSLLAGLLHDDHGDSMTPSHACKRTSNNKAVGQQKMTRRYRYYVSQRLITNARAAAPDGRRIPAGDLEHLVTGRLQAFLSSGAEIVEAIQPFVQDAAEQERCLGRALELARDWPGRSAAETRGLLQVLISRIDVHAETVDIQIVSQRLADVLRDGHLNIHAARPLAEDSTRLTLSVPCRLKRAGLEKRMIIEGADGGKTNPNASLIKLILKAHQARDALLQGDGISIGRFAKRRGISGSYLTRLLRLTFLAPELTRAILDGRQPLDLSAAKLIRHSRLPLDWRDQRTLLGFS